MTYHACKALTSIYGPLHLIAFDAHHDSYPSLHLNHYTVFYHLQAQLKAKITLIGCRKDRDKQTIATSEIGSPCYLSVDVDFFSPTFIGSVVDPVICADAIDYSVETFCSTLAQLDCDIIGGDIVEWGGEAEGTDEFTYVKTLSEKMVDFINKDGRNDESNQ